MAEEKNKKVKVDDLPVKPKNIDDAESEKVFGGTGSTRPESELSESEKWRYSWDKDKEKPPDPTIPQDGTAPPDIGKPTDTTETIPPAGSDSSSSSTTITGKKKFKK